MTASLPEGWRIVDGHHLEFEHRCKTFRHAFDVSSIVAEVAEQKGHHPIICTQWGLVTIRCYTHRVNGLTDRDFVLAVAIDAAI
ncbi:MAG: 4a-hydroxytetrahydrobiopterin dehydratase, partial [Cyanobacteria bacterium]|nr:4a-hydroxytetrahydrobiopterin dehydratase [Cyanobacteriota bacterium]